MYNNICIDLGNYFLKYKSDEVMDKISARATKEFNPNPTYFDRVEIAGQEIVYIGTGDISREFNKVNKEFWVEQVLFCVSKCIKENYKNINLSLLLPINQLQQKDKYIQQFKNKKYEATINGVSRVFYFNEISVLPEGICSYYTLGNIKDKDILILDIGSRTLNVAVFEQGKMMKNFTEKLGSFDLLTRIKNIEMANGSDYTEEEIERLIRNGNITVARETYLMFLKDVLNKIKSQVNIKTYKTYITGGGSLLLKPFINGIPVEVMKDAEFSNVNGGKILSDKVWGK